MRDGERALISKPIERFVDIESKRNQTKKDVLRIDYSSDIWSLGIAVLDIQKETEKMPSSFDLLNYLFIKKFEDKGINLKILSFTNREK
ncbi:hypothetical protein F8388_010126 [Cannabis sativa]|uniref:Uncharacterized protein n=1 Tax=Cannabis sativa TaxID=3483 RepID=A0A7J6GT64_CANSA|nr:hypothetical protein G4B88_029340 [Cannabis sativa]KAF4385570.1 hypothetical protein F8388_010126 [Cannabis sativa]